MIDVLKGHVEALGHQVSNGLDLALERPEIGVEIIPQDARDAVLPGGRELIEDEDHRRDEGEQSVVLEIGEVNPSRDLSTLRTRPEADPVAPPSCGSLQGTASRAD